MARRLSAARQRRPADCDATSSPSPVAVGHRTRETAQRAHAREAAACSHCQHRTLDAVGPPFGPPVALESPDQRGDPADVFTTFAYGCGWGLRRRRAI